MNPVFRRMFQPWRAFGDLCAALIRCKNKNRRYIRLQNNAAGDRHFFADTLQTFSTANGNDLKGTRMRNMITMGEFIA